MKNKKILTYISLFSGAGVGCYGLKNNGFECVATLELLKERMEIQKNNKKCIYNDGYIEGDILDKNIYQRLFDNIDFWKHNHKIESIDIVLATPPCQGMSTANYKKNNEIKRNSLVVKAIDFINETQPKIFVFENVKSFLKTICTDNDGENKLIEKAIYERLEKKYAIYSKVINFKNYGVPSSRPRTIVIGTRRDLINISPILLFPLPQKEIPINESILHLKSLKYGEIDENDVYHFSRKYPRYMEQWISNLRPGENAFKHSEIKPYKLIGEKKVTLKSEHLGNKFKRLNIDKPCACINTRSDQLASQETIHPFDNRVLSIRELMILMTIPDNFKWSNINIEELKTQILKESFLKRNELTIRRAIGESIPTKIINEIGKTAKELLDFEEFIKNKTIFSNNFYIESKIFEESLEQKKEGSYYTPNLVVFDSIKNLKIKSKKISILEPAVGLGAFLIQLIRIFDFDQIIEIDIIDINENVLEFLKNHNFKFLSNNIKINYFNDDFLKFKFSKKYDLIVSNPPFFKVDKKKIIEYNRNIRSKNIFAMFLEKFINLSDDLVFLAPKSLLMANEFEDLRIVLQKYNLIKVIDMPVGTFRNVYIEIVCIQLSKRKEKATLIENFKDRTEKTVELNYPYHKKAWLIYRDEWFDSFIKKLELDIFDFYRDRQITNKYLSNQGKIRVLRSKNIDKKGRVISIKGYDKFIDNIDNFVAKKIINKNYFIFPNFTYNTRVAKLPKNTLTNGSIIVLIPKKSVNLKDFDLSFYSSREFIQYYSIVKNKSKFTINIDSSSIYYLGVKK